MRLRPWIAALAGLPLLLSGVAPALPAAAAAPVQIILNGQLLPLDPAPTIVDDRTLVPLRGLFEAMGATLDWNGETRTVLVTRGESYIRLKIDRRLACLEQNCYRAATLDVPARIISDRTFVPVRFISQTLGAHVSWDNDRRAVLIDTQRAPEPQPAPVAIDSLITGQVVRGPTPLQASGVVGSHIQFYLLDPASGMGHMIGAGSDPSGAYTYTPDPGDAGVRLVVAGIRDSGGVMRYSDPVTVVGLPDTSVRVAGLDEGGLVDGPITFGSDLGFVATQIAFTLSDPATGRSERLGTAGPGESITWYPQIEQNGTKQIRAIATDKSGAEFASEPVTIHVRSGYRQFLSGTQEGAVLSQSVTLGVSTNYLVESVQYLLNDSSLGWGLTHTWKIAPADSGRYTLRVRITAVDGTVNEIGPISVRVDAQPRIWPSGIGPNQVVTGPVTLNTDSNVEIVTTEYHLLNEEGTQSIALIGRAGEGEAFTWTPHEAHAGTQRLMAMARTATGELLRSQIIPFRVYLGQLYGPQPVVPKSEFLRLATELSAKAYRETGMSAALKTAQSILETGWGQYGPVDKYTGQVSLNLFGIKGTGPAGSIISNTWEEYNGVAYRVDDNFRAYYSVAESWKDHADLLLTRSWYAPYRAVMTNPVLGAWALRRSGYATDSQYPVKLINIIKEYDLFKLDLIEF